MGISAVGGSQPAAGQTIWTRAERACAAHHRGDAYYDLLADRPDNPTSTPVVSSAPASGLQPGFTLHL